MPPTRPQPTSSDHHPFTAPPSIRSKRKAHQMADDASRDASMAVVTVASSSRRMSTRRSDGVVEPVVKETGKKSSRSAPRSVGKKAALPVEVVNGESSCASTPPAQDTESCVATTAPDYKSKRFLSSGLFAPSHHHRLPISHPHFSKPQTVLSRRRSLTTKASTSKSTLLPTEYKHRFPPLPMHHMLDQMDQDIEFKIPFDIMYEWENGRLTSGVKPKPKKYQKISKNVYVDRSAAKVDGQWAAICHCQPDSGCRERCLNRVMNYLCGKDCPSGENCTNRSLASRQQAPYRVFFTGKRGFGLQATKPIKKGDFIMDYRGEVIHMNTFYKRIRDVYAGRSDFYALSYDTDEVIDAGLRGNDARFINHSCGPNLEVHKYQTLGMGYDEFEVGFWASRDIAEGEELFYNYNFDSFTTIQRPANHPEFNASPIERRQRCYCGADNCSGWLGKKPDSNTSLAPSSAKEVVMRKTKPKVASQVGKVKVIKKGLVSLVAAAKKISHTTAKTKVVGKNTLTVLKAVSTVRRPNEKRTVKEVPPKRSRQKVVDRATAIHAPKKLIEDVPKRAHLKKTVEQALKRSHNKKSITQPSIQSDVPKRSHKKNVVEGAPIRSPKKTKSLAHPSGQTQDAPKRSHRKKVVVDAQSIPNSVDSSRSSQRARNTLAQRVTEALLPEPTQPLKLGAYSARSVFCSTRTTRRSMPVLEQPSMSEGPVDLPLLAISDCMHGLAPISGSSNADRALSTIDDLQETSASTSRSSPPTYTNSEAMISEVASIVTSSSRQDNTVASAVYPSGSALLNVPIIPTRIIVASAMTPMSFNPKVWNVVDSKHRSSVQVNLVDLLEASIVKADQSSTLTNDAACFSRNRSRSWTHRDFTPPPPYSPLTPFGGAASQLAAPAPVVTMTEGQEGNRANYGPPPDEGSYDQGYGGDEPPSYPNQDNNEGGGQPPTDSGAGGNGRDDGGGDPGRNDGNGDDDFSGESDSEDELDENGNPIRRHVDQNGQGPSLDEQAAQAAFGADQFSLEDYSRHPDLVALVAENLNENAARQRKKGKKSRRGRLTDVEEALARTIESASRQGISREDGENDDDDEHLNDAQRAVQKAARAAAKAERQRLRDDEDGSKKRRNKWVLPLDDEQIELERRKKKKGQKWLDAMKGLAAAKRAASGIPDPVLQDGDQSIQQEFELDVSSDDDGSESDMTELDEHEDKDKTDDQTEGGRSDLKEGGADGDAPTLPPKPKRIRKPRPPRRFKTTLTRLRPKLEAALTSVSQEEEDAALEQERRRRKKGLVWLDAMKALARAKREAQQAQVEGRPVPEFVLPPTSLIPSGKRKSKKNRGDTEETTGAGDESIEDGASAATAAEVAALLPPGDTSLAAVEQLDSEIPGGIPAFMFPPDHPAAQGHRTDPQANTVPTTLPDYLDPQLMANAAAAAAAFERSQEMSGDGVPTSTSFSAYMPQFPTAQANLAGAYGGHHESTSAGQYNDGDYRFDNNAYGQQVYHQDQGTSGQDVQSNDYQTNVQTFGGLPSFNLPVFDPFQRDDGLAGSPGSATHQLANMPPVPVLSRASETPTAKGEKRKRGPPVKKIAGSTVVPLTDEQWEAERKKRKKGYSWVAETKAAAEAERQAAALRASGIKPPRKPKSNSRRTADALAATEQAAADQAQLQYDPSQVGIDHHQGQDHYGQLDLGLSGDVDQGGVSVTDQQVQGGDVSSQQQAHHDDVLPYPTMNESLIGQDQPYGGLQQAYQTAGQAYGLDMQMYNAEEAANAYVGAAAEQIYHQAIDPYQAMQHQGGE